MESTRDDQPKHVDLEEIFSRIAARYQYLSMQKEYIAKLKNKTIPNADQALADYLYDLFGITIDTNDRQFKAKALELLDGTINSLINSWKVIHQLMETFMNVSKFFKDEERYNAELDKTICKLYLYLTFTNAYEHNQAKLKSKNIIEKGKIILTAFESYNDDRTLYTSLEYYLPEIYNEFNNLIVKSSDGAHVSINWVDYKKEFDEQDEKILKKFGKFAMQISENVNNALQDTKNKFHELIKIQSQRKSQLTLKEIGVNLLNEFNYFLWIHPAVVRTSKLDVCINQRIKFLDDIKKLNEQYQKIENEVEFLVDKDQLIMIKKTLIEVEYFSGKLSADYDSKSEEWKDKMIEDLVADKNSIQSSLNSLSDQITNHKQSLQQQQKERKKAKSRKKSELANKRQLELAAAEQKHETKIQQETEAAQKHKEAQIEKTNNWKNQVAKKQKEKQNEKQKMRSVSLFPAKVEVILKADPKLKEKLKAMNPHHIDLIKSILNGQIGITYNELYNLIKHHLGRIEEKSGGSSHKRIIIESRAIEIMAYDINEDGNEITPSPQSKSLETVGGTFNQHGKKHTTRQLCHANISLVKDVFERAGIKLALAEIEQDQKAEKSTSTNNEMRKDGSIQ